MIHIDGVRWSERADGSPVRLRGNGRSATARGLYFSVKSGCHLPYESHLELHDLWRAEVDVEVVRSCALMVRRAIVIELSDGLTPTSLVSLP